MSSSYTRFVYLANNSIAVTPSNSSLIDDEYPSTEIIAFGGEYTDVGLVLSASKRHPMLDVRHSLVNGIIQADELDLIVRAKALAEWHTNFNFCIRCGQPASELAADLGHHCSCGHIQYPQISPCMIVLVEKGDYCLLAHHRRHQQPIYSTLAGFIEIGETLEACVHREVYEEAGVRVGDIQYFSSQSWPMPNQLMLGVHAQYESGTLERCDVELHDLGWFHYQDLPLVPSTQTVAGQLINDFVERRKLLNNPE